MAIRQYAWLVSYLYFHVHTMSRTATVMASPWNNMRRLPLPKAHASQACGGCFPQYKKVDRTTNTSRERWVLVSDGDSRVWSSSPADIFQDCVTGGPSHRCLVCLAGWINEYPC